MPGKTSTKPKPASKKPTSKKPASKKGGSDIVQNVSGLAVPFAFLLAKQGLEAMKKKTPASPKKAAKKPSPARKGSMAGGSCSSCSTTTTPQTMSGGAKARSAELSAKLEKLRSNIDNFLSKY